VKRNSNGRYPEGQERMKGTSRRRKIRRQVGEAKKRAGKDKKGGRGCKQEAVR
jgi:hypothetical protein